MDVDFVIKGAIPAFTAWVGAAKSHPALAKVFTAEVLKAMLSHDSGGTTSAPAHTRTSQLSRVCVC